MMGYIDQLKAINLEKRSPNELQKVQKAPSYSFCSTHSEHISKINAPPTHQQKDELVALVRRVYTAEGWQPADITEAIKIALADYHSALVCFTDLARSQRYGKALAMLNSTPDMQRALVANLDDLPGQVILTIAKRGVAVFEVQMPVEKYDPFKIMALVDKYSNERN
jgi:hypothetical protein